MFLKNKPTLLSDAAVVRQETADRHNTAQRVGSLLIDIINSIDATFTAIDDYIQQLVSNAVANMPGNSGTADIDLTLYATRSWVQSQGYLKKHQDLSDYATRTWVQSQGYLKSHQDISHLLPKETFDSMFELVTPEEGDPYIRAKYSFASVGEIVNHASDGLIVGSHLLGAVDITAPEEGQSLVYRNGRWVNESVAYGGGGLDEAQLASYLSSHGYVTDDILGDYVTRNTAQNIAGQKTFEKPITIIGSPAWYPAVYFNVPNQTYISKLQMDSNGWINALAYNDTDFTRYRPLKAASFVRYGGTSAQFLKADGTIDATAYLNKAGDTMTGNLVINPSNTNTGYNEGIRINEHTTTKWASLYLGGAQGSVQGASGNAWLIGVNPDKHLIIRSQPHDGIDTHLRITQSEMLWKGGKVWCATNDGTGSGLDADLLDGYHSADFMRSNAYAPMDLNNAVTAGSYRLERDHTNNPTGNYSQLLVIHGAADTIAQMIFPYASSTGFLRTGNPVNNTTGKWNGWRELAFVDSNIASATKLQTARSIFGNNFDGSKEVTGPRVQVDGQMMAPNCPNIMFHIPNVCYTQIQMEGNGALYIRDGGSQTGALKDLCLGSVYANNWFRSTGNTGWYNETYKGGIYMSDTTYIRTYGGKSFYCDQAIQSGSHMLVGASLSLLQTGGVGHGISLYGGADNVQKYGILFGKAANFGKHGSMQGEWATYFTMDGPTDRGWCFRHTTAGIVASISAGGNLMVNGEMTNHSDRRLKHNIADVRVSERLRPVSFTKDGARHVGLIAQEVQELCPEVVRTGDDPQHLLSLNYVGALCYGIAGVYAEIDALKAEIRRLKNLLTR